MGRLIEFYRPTIKAPGAHGPDGPHKCVINHVSDKPKARAENYHLCECGMEWETAPADLPTVIEGIAPGDVLRELLEKASDIDDLVVLMRNKDGKTGLVGTLEGAAETYLFVEMVKREMLDRLQYGDPEPDPTRRA